METLVANVHVRIHGRDGGRLRDAAIAGVRQYVLHGPYVELGDADENADRIVLIGPAGPGPWLVVYDEELENQDETRLRRLTEVLAATVDDLALGVYARAVDDLFLALYRPDAPSATLGRGSGGSASLSEPRVTLVGDPEPWLPLLARGASIDDLRAAAATRTTLVDEVLGEIGAVLGLAPRQIALSRANLTRGDVDLAGFARLRFRATTQAAEHRAAGLPRLVARGGSPARTFAHGDRIGVAPAASLGATVYSGGAGSRGLRLRVGGSAVDRGSIELSGGSLVRRGDKGAIADILHVSFVLVHPDGHTCYEAVLPDVDIPKGLPPPSYSLGLEEPVDRHGLDAAYATWFGLDLRGIARIPGHATLELAFAPLTNPDHGQAVWSIPVTIAASKD